LKLDGYVLSVVRLFQGCENSGKPAPDKGFRAICFSGADWRFASNYNAFPEFGGGSYAHFSAA
jgi:hypothetical protein